MNKGATAEDILLAYDPDFVGLNSMAYPLESEAEMVSITDEKPVRGGAQPRDSDAEFAGAFTNAGALSDDPDGYYDDFTTHLQRAIHAGGGSLTPNAPNWNAMIVYLDDPDDSEDESEMGADGDAAPEPASIADFVVSASGDNAGDSTGDAEERIGGGRDLAKGEPVDDATDLPDILSAVTTVGGTPDWTICDDDVDCDIWHAVVGGVDDEDGDSNGSRSDSEEAQGLAGLVVACEQSATTEETSAAT